MGESKNKICKYPKCQKEIPGEKGILCSHHKKSVKETSEAIGVGSVAIVGAAGALVLAVIRKKE